MYSLTGKTALVTGAGSGIGRGTALRLAEAGASVVAMDVEPKGLQETVRLGKGAVVASEGDVRSPEAWKQAVEAAGGRVSILVNNAAIFLRGDAENTTLDLWNTTLAINLTGPFLGVQAVLPGMLEARDGRIINIGSVNIATPGKSLLPYSVSKGGLLTMTRNLAGAYFDRGIRSNMVSPGWVHTEGEKKIQMSLGHPEDYLEQSAKNHPFGRLQTPDDIAQMVHYLASSAAEMISGQEFKVYLRGRF